MIILYQNLHKITNIKTYKSVDNLNLKPYNEYMNNYSYIERKYEDMDEDLICTEKHQDIINSVKEKMPKEEILFDIAELFKVFGDSTRMKIICCLFEEEMCVCDIAEIINSTQSAVSHQLRVLKQAKLVKYRKEGKAVYYSLSDKHVEIIFNMAFEHIQEL